MKSQLAFYQQRINQKLEAFLLQHDQHSRLTYPKELAEAIHYATLNNGKRLRPALLYAVGEACGIELAKLDSAAIAIELIHSYSLVHDDLPAMDDDELRRGQPTCHIRYDEATAILVGDAQQTLAFECLANDPLLSTETRISLIRILSEASGPSGMIGGQFIDIRAAGKLPSQDALQKMHQMKTGALIQAALRMGACQSEHFKTLSPRLADFGDQIGLAFQVQDDILDIEGSSDVLGKPQGSDEAMDKSTYPKLLGLEAAKTYRDQLIESAEKCLVDLKMDTPFLVGLTRYISTRSH
ncbi:MAG: polyprenyl synthetase family protein [Hydrogenovibrio sp.]|nr:polyprenyl synthetase family protein [Hydrogenovibrio sp.]